MANYSTIQQHEPLRTPSSFDKQGKALIVQLDEIFDDIYRRFGRLKVSDLGSELRDLCLVKNADGKYVSIDLTLDNMSIEFSEELDGKISKTEQYQDAESIISAAELYTDGVLTDYSTTEQTAQAISTYVTTALGDYSTTQQTAQAIALAVGDCYGKVSKITINSSGIEIDGSKDVVIKAGSKLLIKSTDGTVNQILMRDTGMYLRSGGVLQIESGADLKLASGGTLTVSGGNLGVDSSGNATLKGGVEILSGRDLLVKSNGNMEIQSGATMKVKSQGSMTIETGGTFSITTGNFGIDSNGAAQLKGNVEITSGKHLYVKASGEMEIQSQGKMRIQSGGILYVYYGGGVYFRNSNNDADRFSMDDNGIRIFTGGAIDVRSGGAMSIQTGGTFSISSGNFDIDNTGATTLKGGVEILSGRDLLIQSQGEMKVKSGGSLSIETGGSFSITTGNFGIDQYGAAQLKGNVEITSGKHLYVKASGEMEIESQGKMRILSGGEMHVRYGGAIHIRNSNNDGDRISIDDNGIRVLTGGAIDIRNGGSFTIQSGSTFTVSSGGEMLFLANNLSNRIKLKNTGITIFSDAGVDIMSGGQISIMSSGDSASAITLNRNGLTMFSGTMSIRAGASMEIWSQGTLEIKSGGALSILSDASFTLYSSNIDIDTTGLVVKQGSLRGSHYASDGTPMLSRRDIVVSSTAPYNPKAGTLWVKPAAGTVVVNYSYNNSQKAAADGFTATLSSSNNTSASGSLNTYRVQLVVHADTSSGNGIDIVIYAVVNGSSVLSFPVHVNPGYYSGGAYYGDTAIDVQGTSASWFGSESSIGLVVSVVSGDHWTSYKIAPGSITLTCTSNSGSSAGWADCEIKVYQ